MFRLFLGALALSFFASCGVVQDELYRSGGYLGGQADNFMKASTPRQRFDRYMLLTMILAPSALETAIDSEDAHATIRRVNSLYYSLANMRRAIHCTAPNTQTIDAASDVRPQGRSLVVCDALQQVDDVASNPNWGGNGQNLPATAYDFETLEFEVQQDLFFVARAVVTNLNLEADPQDLINLNPLTLARVWRRVEELLPMFRHTAARFRGGLILYADISQASCDYARSTNTACRQLRELMSNRYRGQAPSGGFSDELEIEQRDLRQMLRLARTAFDASRWQLGAPQYVAIIGQIDHSCAVAFQRQSVDEVAPGAPTNNANCGVPTSKQASPQRMALVEELRQQDFAPRVEINDDGTIGPQPDAEEGDEPEADPQGDDAGDAGAPEPLQTDGEDKPSE